MKSVASGLESKVSMLTADLARVTNQYANLEAEYNRLREDRTSIEGELIRVQGEKASLDSTARLKISQLEDRLQAFSQSINLAESHRTTYEQQSFDDKTKITQMESKLSELNARIGIFQQDKERFVTDNERLKRELLSSKESFNMADSERYSRSVS